MLAKQKEKERAIYLREAGLAYSEILKKIPVAKSTISLWLRTVSLSVKQKQRLTEKKIQGALRGAQKRHLMRMERWRKIKTSSRKKVGALSRRERWVAGVMLYWAEGSKEKIYRGGNGIRFSNSDVVMIVLFREWLREFFKISEKKIWYELYIHEKADWDAVRNFWALKLGVTSNDIRVYFKRHNPSPKRKNTGKEYHGVLRIAVKNSVDCLRELDGWIQGVSDSWGVV
ncbi:MAG: hypothetical protein HYY92_02305 [Parcubacteria group bacterium]|nr:hypothetical protein [Parcubacteria group bacterium]